MELMPFHMDGVFQLCVLPYLSRLVFFLLIFWF